MVSANANHYFEMVVDITTEYLGPAAERFVRRQIDFHLSKPPETIDWDDVVKIRDSVCIALSLLVADKEMVAEASRKFDKILEPEK